MEGLKNLEKILFAQEFSNNPNIPSFQLVVNGDT